MKTRNASIKMILGSGIAATLCISPVIHAEQNPFALKPLTHGYMVAEADQATSDDKMKDGNCSAEMMGETNSSSDDQKDKEGNCSAEKKGSDTDPGEHAK